MNGQGLSIDVFGNKVRIIKWDVLYGTGDFEDPKEIRDDKFTECYYVLYEDLSREGVFNADR